MFVLANICLLLSFLFFFLYVYVSHCFFFFFFLMIRRPPRSTLFPYTRSSDLPFVPTSILFASTASMWNIRLYGGEQGPVRRDETVGHTGSVKGEAGIPVAVEENEPTGGVCAFAQENDGFAPGDIRRGENARRGPRSIKTKLTAS